MPSGPAVIAHQMIAHQMIAERLPDAVDQQIFTFVPEHMKLALWHSHLHGKHANLLWYLGRKQNGEINEQGKR